MTKVFIDGSAGTTGLRIHERLAGRDDIELILLPDEVRKDADARAEAINSADIVFLCLPDAAAVEAVGMIKKSNSHTRIIDTSTAHRVADGWIYGFPEIGGRRKAIKNARLVANPGCHASGFIALAAPLVEAGIIDRADAISCTSLTGYSGGGKKMIAEYEADGRDALLDAPRLYGLTQSLKHLPEMTAVCGLLHSPVFCPIVAPFYAGMEVIVPVFGRTPDEIADVYRAYYTGDIVKFACDGGEGGFMSAGKLSGRDDMEISVSGIDGRCTVVSRFDNLGKGASGAAIQNMNIMLGVAETTGLIIE